MAHADSSLADSRRWASTALADFRIVYHRCQMHSCKQPCFKVANATQKKRVSAAARERLQHKLKTHHCKVCRYGFQHHYAACMYPRNKQPYVCRNDKCPLIGATMRDSAGKEKNIHPHCCPPMLAKQFNSRKYWRGTDDFIRLRRGKDMILPRQKHVLRQYRSTFCPVKKELKRAYLGERTYWCKLREFPRGDDWCEDEYDYSPLVCDDEFNRAHGMEGRIFPIRTTPDHGPSNVASLIFFDRIMMCNVRILCLPTWALR